MLSYSGYSQTNTLPPSGNVGIGTTTPSSALQVNGTARIDSSLIVKDSIVIHKTARVKSDIKVDGNAVFKENALIKNDFKVQGNSVLIGDVVVKEGSLKVKSLGDTTQTEKGMLVVNKYGKVENGGPVQSIIYAEPAPPTFACPQDANGNTIISSPTWINAPEKMYLLNHQCMEDVKVGVGVVPEAKLHIKTSYNYATHPLLIEKNLGTNQAPKKLLELTNDGLLYARQVKVNANNWPDYVFESNYTLQPLSELEHYITKNKHLPEIPSAKTIEAEGVDVGEMNKLLLKKVEELTLHLIEQHKTIEEQNKRIELLESKIK